MNSKAAYTNYNSESWLNPPIATSSGLVVVHRHCGDRQDAETTAWLDNDSTLAQNPSSPPSTALNNRLDIDIEAHDVSDFYLETTTMTATTTSEDMSIARCAAASTFQMAHEPLRRGSNRRGQSSYMSLRSSSRHTTTTLRCPKISQLRFIDDSCLLMPSEIADHSHQSYYSDRQNDDDDDDEFNQTYVSELPTVLPDFEPSSSSSSSSSSNNSSNESIMLPSDNNSVQIGNNTSIKAPTCRSLYKYLVKRVSKRLVGSGGSCENKIKSKSSATQQQQPQINQKPQHEPLLVSRDNSKHIHVYAHNHKRDSHAIPSTSTANTSSATVAFLVHRRSNFYATNNEALRASPIGMRNFEWNRLNCGEFFSYNV